MGLVENIFGAIILIFLFLIVGILIVNRTAVDARATVEAEQLSFKIDTYSNDMNSILLVTEPVTRKSFGNLLADALYTRNSTIEHGNLSFDVLDKTKKLLDSIYGQGRYYMEIRPQIKEVGLSFVFDGSPSLEEKRKELAKDLNTIVLAAAENRHVDVNIYLLTNSTLCTDNGFDNVLNFQINPQVFSSGICQEINGINNTGHLYFDKDVDDYRKKYFIIPPYNFNPGEDVVAFADDFEDLNFTNNNWYSLKIFGYNSSADDDDFIGNYSYGIVVYDGKLKFSGDGKNELETIITTQSFLRTNFPTIRLDFKFDAWETNMTIESNSSSSTHGILVDSDNQKLKTTTGQIIHNSPELNKWYTLEIEFDNDESRLYLYETGLNKPLRPDHINREKEWSPYLKISVDKGRAEVDNVQVLLGTEDYPTTRRDPKDYYETDWAAGSAYASSRVSEKLLSRLDIIFPVSDELSTSSIAHECFTYPFTAAARVVCDLCAPSCSKEANTSTENRSLASVQRYTEMAKAYGHVVDPIFAYECNYRSENPPWEYWNPWYNINYSYSNVFFDIPEDQTFCNDTQCLGCSEEDGGVCFHPNCTAEVLSQMKYLAEETNGRVINLRTQHLSDTIIESIEDNINKYKFTIGEKEEEKERLVFKRFIPFPETTLQAEFILWVYTN